MFCDTKCLLCDQDQASKINHSFYHGVCTFHKSNLNPILICYYCNSNVQVNKIVDITNCYACNNITTKKSSPCGHILCENCEKECSLCKQNIIDLHENFSFRQTTINELPKTQTLINEEKYFENPEIIHLRNSISKNKCDFCMVKSACNLLECNHYLCDDCLTEGKCNLCIHFNSSFSNTMNLKNKIHLEEEKLNGFIKIPLENVEKECQTKDVSDNHSETIVVSGNPKRSTKIYADESFLLNINSLAKSDICKINTKLDEDKSKDSLLNANSKNESYLFECISFTPNENPKMIIDINQISRSTSNSKNNSYNSKSKTASLSINENDDDDDEKCCCSCTLF
ncbi:hypothetical protein SteCoe_15342 [Stentor coeruleus]|uniref:RING-type domain-containing protein n=1 Tax=Stentor coeruleus TaxID=5963 RepID=A0A1R2C3S8_9CILI|nr:hypothetical protein SteCoe_15342 [Stentor coeruleus]